MSLKEDQRKAIRPEGIKDGGHDDLGVHPERREAEADDLDNLYNQEARDDEDRNTNPDKATKSEQESLPNEDGGHSDDSSEDDDSEWNNNVKGKKNKKGKINGRRLAVGGAGSGLLLGIGIGLSVFLSGPLRIIHYAMLLNQFHDGSSSEFSSRRISKLYRYAKKLTGLAASTGSEDLRLSYSGNKLALHYEKGLAKNGIQFDYDTHGTLATITIDPNSDGGKRLLDKIEERHGVRPQVDPETGHAKLELATNSNDIADMTGRRVLVGDAVEATGFRSKISQAMAKRLLKKRAGLPSMFHPIERLKAKWDEKLWLKYDEWRNKSKEDINEKIKNGEVDTDIKTKNPTDPDTGQPVAADDIAGATENMEAELKAKNIPLKEKFSGIQAKLKAPAGILAFTGLLCGLHGLGDGVAQLQESNVVLPSIRLASSTVTSVASQIMSGEDLTMMDLAPIVDQYYDEVGKTDFMDAESIQYNLGNPDTGVPIPSSAKPGRNKPLFFQYVDNIVNGARLGSTCSALNTGIGQAILAATDLGMAILSGGGSLAFTAVTTAGGAVLGQQFGDDIVKFFAGQIVDLNSLKGGEFGAVADSGKFLANNNAMMALGGRALTSAERLALINENNAKIKEEYQNKPVYARMFDIKDPHSLISKTLIDNRKLQDTQVMANSVVSSPFRVFNYLGSTISSLNPKTFAQTTPYDYGVDQFGFSVEERDSELVDNPYENEKEIHNKLPELNEEYGECFGTTIDPATGKFKTTEAKSYVDLEKIKNKCGSNNKDQDFLRYRMYLADSVLMATATCYTGVDEESCADLDIGNAAAQKTNDAGGLGQNNIIVGDTSNLTCNVGTDAGVGDGYESNKLYKIRLCTVGNGNITVNAQIAENIEKLIQDAKNAGINFSGGGFRSMQSQIILRTQNNCPDVYNAPSSSCGTPTARPGYSNHQMGLAIDFSQNGSILNKGASGYSWLQANASKYGLKNLPSEAWHWSVDGT